MALNFNFKTKFTRVTICAVKNTENVFETIETYQNSTVSHAIKAFNAQHGALVKYIDTRAEFDANGLLL